VITYLAGKPAGSNNG